MASESTPTKKNRTTLERTSERELAVTRVFNAPPRIVYEAWTKPELLQRWWAPKSTGMVLLSCEADVRVDGKYRFVFRHGEGSMAFHGTYLEVVPSTRLVWTNEESGENGPVSTLTLEEKSGKTLLVLRELYASKEALDAAIVEGLAAGDAQWIGEFIPANADPAQQPGGGLAEMFEQLDAELGTRTSTIH